MDIILKSLPFEMIIIGGAAVGAFIISSDIHGIKHTMKDLGKVFKGNKWMEADYRDLLCLLYQLIRMARKNPVKLEEHIEMPNESAIFSQYPKILEDDQPPEILGKLIGGALVGTFLGVFLAYGLVGPFATKIKSVVDEDSYFYGLIRDVLVANLYQHSINNCIEVGRQNTPQHIRPSFSDLEHALKNVRSEAS